MPPLYSRLLLCLWLGYSVAQADVRTTQQKIDKVHGSINALENTLQVQQARQKNIAKKLRNVESEIVRTLRKLRQANEKIRLENEQLEKLTRQKHALDKELTSLKTAVEAYLTAVYMTQNSGLKRWLGADSLADLDRYTVYRKYLYADQLRKMDRLVEAMQAVESLEQKMQQRLENIRLARDDAVRKQQALKKSHRERKQLLASIDKKIAGSREELAELKVRERRLQVLLGKLSGQSQATDSDSRSIAGNIVQKRGHLRWPVSAKIHIRYGKKRSGGMRWNGIVLNASPGTQVKAVFSGKIVFSDWLRGYGLLVIIDHGEGIMSLYGYNELINRFTGEYVNAGEPIAQSGTDDQNRSGSYFGMRVNGKPTDPLRWLARSNKG